MTSEHKQRIESAFNTVAGGYDHPAAEFFPETARRMVDHLQLKFNESLLDVCSGTGVLSMYAAVQLSQGSVTGIDLSDGMLQKAYSKLQYEELHNVTFQQMDMENMSFPDRQFDVAACNFGLFFLEDMENGLRHIASKVKPGGKIGISTFVPDAFEPMSSLFIERYESYGKEVTPISWKRLASEEAMKEIFAAAGIETVEVYEEPQGFDMTSAQEWWDIIWNAGFRGLLQQLNDDEQAELKEKHMEEINQLCASKNIRMNTGAIIAVGTKSTT